MSNGLCTKSHVNPDNHVNPVKHAFEWGVFTGFTGLDMIYMMIMDTRNRLFVQSLSNALRRQRQSWQ